MRVDYIFTGNNKQQAIYLDELSQLPSWQVVNIICPNFRSKATGRLSSEISPPDSVSTRLPFLLCFKSGCPPMKPRRQPKASKIHSCFPTPKQPAEVEIVLFSPRKEVMTSFKHIVRPDDILIHKRGTSHVTPHRYMLQSGNEKECIDVAILAEGYTEKEMDLFYQDAQKACESLFSHKPFRSMKNKFNIVAVASPSIDSGVSVPRENQWKHTAVHSHFDTFYSDRYLTTSRVKAIHNALAGIPYEHIIILANTDVYGGGGIYNSYTLTTAHHPMFKPVVVHEFGHSFGGLADEYFYDDDVMTDTYPLDVEPWEQNISTRVNFALKWEDMLAPNTPVPTPVAQHQNYPVGVYEGGGYSAKGIYRPAFNCRMKTNEYPEFCGMPACYPADY